MDALQPKWMREGAKQSSTSVRLVTVTVIAILAIVVLAASVTVSSTSQESQTPLQRHHPHFQRPGGWTFDVARDARNLGMSEWQCDVCGSRSIASANTNTTSGSFPTAVRRTRRDSRSSRSSFSLTESACHLAKSHILLTQPAARVDSLRPGELTPCCSTSSSLILSSDVHHRRKAWRM